MTPFGKLARQFRRERLMLLGDIAELLGKTPAYISQVETGKKKIPEDFSDQVADALVLNEKERAELRHAANISAKQFIVSMPENASERDRELAHKFAVSFARMDSRDKERLRGLMKGTPDE
ncbi:MAG: helix-turn-helix transcriptional regulator [Pseudomonadota bacterium]